MIETTPYGIRETPDGWEVWQEWWDRKVGGPFATREEAASDAMAAKRQQRTSDAARLNAAMQGSVPRDIAD